MAKRRKQTLFENNTKELESTIALINMQKEKELNSRIACELLRIYFEEIASRGLKRQLTLSDIVKAYKFTLEMLEGKGELQKNSEAEKMSTLMEIKQAIEMPKAEEKPYVYINEKGETYYLHKKGSFYYFSKDHEKAVPMPSGYHVEENKRTGMPILRKDSA